MTGARGICRYPPPRKSKAVEGLIPVDAGTNPVGGQALTHRLLLAGVRVTLEGSLPLPEGVKVRVTNVQRSSTLVDPRYPSASSEPCSHPSYCETSGYLEAAESVIGHFKSRARTGIARVIRANGNS